MMQSKTELDTIYKEILSVRPTKGMNTPVSVKVHGRNCYGGKTLRVLNVIKGVKDFSEIDAFDFAEAIVPDAPGDPVIAGHGRELVYTTEELAPILIALSTIATEAGKSYYHLARIVNKRGLDTKDYLLKLGPLCTHGAKLVEAKKSIAKLTAEFFVSVHHEHSDDMPEKTKSAIADMSKRLFSVDSKS